MPAPHSGGQIDPRLPHLGQLVAQCARADAEPVGYRLAAAVAVLQGIEDDLVLLLLELAAQMLAATAALTDGEADLLLVHLFQDQVLAADEPVRAQDQGTLHHVVQLPHIAGPGVG